MAKLKLQERALKQAIDNRQTNGYVKTIGVCTKAGYRPADRQMAMLKLQAPVLKQAIDQQIRHMAMLKLQVPALKQAIDQQTDKWLC